MKILRNKNLFGCLFAVLLAFPLINILGRTAYTIVNKNAFESYSDYYINSSFNITNDSQLTLNTYYEISSITSNNQNSNIYYYSSISNDNKWWYSDDAPYDFVAFSFSSGGTNKGIRLYYYDADNNLASVENHSGGPNFVNGLLPIVFKLVNYTSVSTNTYNAYSMQKFTYKAGTLDNAFEYSVSKFVDDNNFGVLDFFGWFEGMFLADNSVNNLYIHFINWYLNYALLISVAYILFLCLMWFINFVRRLLDKGMSFGDRGY